MFDNLRSEFEYYYDKLESNLVSFERDYKDVNNFYRLIQIGTRINDKELLVKECWGIVNNPEYKGTPDLGGALCVIGYNDKNLDIDNFIFLVINYIDSCQIFNANPHNTRWKISLSYLCGLKTNDKNWFHYCVQFINYKMFSSLILTKVLLSTEKIARICLDENNKELATTYLRNGIELYKEGLKFDLDKTVGKNGTYIYFACCELALLSDIASQLVKFLQNINLYYENREAFEKVFEAKRFGLWRYTQELEKENKELKEKLNGNV